MSNADPVIIRGDAIELEVLPGAGARLHSLRVDGRDLLRTPANPAQHLREPFFWGAFVMAPWCNRLAPGPIRVGARTVDLASNFEDGSAIHGQVYAAEWTPAGESSFAIERDGDGWPWRYRVEIAYRVDGMRLTIDQRLRNLSDDAMPGGIGLHPWFPTPVQTRINSALTYGNAKSSTTQPMPVEGDLDMRTQRPLAQGVDATWAEPGDPPFELAWPFGLHATVRAPFPTLHVVAAFAPERGAIAIEPQTQAPYGLTRMLNDEPGAMAVLDPGDEIQLPITIDFERRA
jgi:aldose 1-epimerase